MGTPKQLLPLGDKLVIRHCVDHIAAAGIAETVVVIGEEDSESAAALFGLPVGIVVNDLPESEMADSARLGLCELGGFSSGVFVCLVDHPLATAETMAAMICSHRQHPGKIIIPRYRGKRGHPTLFPALVLKELFGGRTTLRDIVNRDPARILFLDVPDEGVALDMDTPEDYRKALDRMPTPAASLI